MSESNKKTIFISYRRADSPDTVKLIYERLKKELPRWVIFYDHRSIPLGEAFPQRLREEVTTADVVLVIIGPSWLEVLQQRKNQSSMDHVREEVRLAIESGHTVIPVQVVNARNLSGTDLTDFPELQPLTTFNSHRIRPEPDFDNDINKLISSLEQIGPAEGAGSILGGKYKLVRELGAGGMGIVWLAEQLQPRRVVAVKLIKPGMDSREVLARFDAERQAVAVMDHPHIAKVFDAGNTTSGRPFFAMEYVKGVPITEYCDAKRLSPNERLLLFQQVCDAVQHAHQKGILHRDIKPSNVLVEEREGKPFPKVIDFGLAKALGRKLTDMSLHTAFETRVGTLEYSSPEQSAGGAIDVDTRTDIYSLGALLYELLAGEPPFSREELLRAGEIEMHRVIQEQDPRRPSVKLSSSASLPAVAVNRHLEPQKLTAVLRGDLDWIVMKALEKNRSRRYASASGLAEEIQRYLSGDPVQARPPSTGYRIRKYVNKHKGFVASIAAIATLLVLGIISTSWFGFQATLAKNDAETQRSIAENKSRERDEAATKAQQSEQIAVAERDKAEASLARSSYLLANARCNENRVAEALELLDRVPLKHRNVEWYLDRRMFEGSDMTLYGHSNLVTCVAFSSDGLFLVSGSDDHTVRLWDAITGREILTLIGHDASINSVAFSPDRSRVVSCSDDDAIKLWDAKTGEVIRTFVARQRLDAISLDGSRVASGSLNESITVWDVLTGEEIRNFNGPADQSNEVALSHNGSFLASWSFYAPGKIIVWNVSTGKEVCILNENGRVTCVEFLANGSLLTRGSSNDKHKTWDVGTGVEGRDLRGLGSIADASLPTPVARTVASSPDGMLVASASIDRSLTIWNVLTGKDVRTFKGHQGSFRGLAFSPDGARLASGGNDSTIKIWDARFGTAKRTLSGHEHIVNNVAFSPDNMLLASCSFDKTIRLWNVRTGDEIRTLSGHQMSVNDIAFSPDGLQLASGGADETIKLWDVRTGHETSTLGKHPYSVTSVAYSPDGSQLASGASDHSVKIWDIRTRSEVRTLLGHQDEVACVAFSPNGQYLASGSSDRTVKLWDVRTGNEIRTMVGSRYQSCLAFSPNGMNLVTAGSYDDSIRIWDVRNGKNVRTFSQNGMQFLGGISFTPDGSRLICLSERTIKIFDPMTGDELRALESGHQKMVGGIAISPDAMSMATCSRDNTVNLWSLPQGQQTYSFCSNQNRVISVAISRNGIRMASSSYDARLIVWDTSTGEQISTIDAAAFGENSMVLSPDGNQLCSVSQDNAFRMWDCNTGEVISTFRGHRYPVKCVAFSTDGSRLVSGSGDFTIKLWDVRTATELRTFKGHQLSVKSVAFSPDGKRIYSTDVLSNKRVWDCATGDSLPNSEWQNRTDANRKSADGRWLVCSDGLLVDLEFKNTPDEKAYREFKARFDPAWHRKQAELTETVFERYDEINWYAATFHRAWVMKADPDQGKAYDSLHNAYKQWRVTFIPRARGGSVNVNDGTQPNADNSLKKNTGNESIDPDLFLQPIVREMLKLPRGPKD